MTESIYLNWWVLGQIALIWLYMAGKTGAWLTGIALRLFSRRSSTSRLNAAVNEIFEAHPLEDNQTLSITTKDQWTVVVCKRTTSEVKHDA